MTPAFIQNVPYVGTCQRHMPPIKAGAAPTCSLKKEHKMYTLKQMDEGAVGKGNYGNIKLPKAHIKRFIPLKEVRECGHYNEMADLAMIFSHRIVETPDGVWRWKKNYLIDWMDHAPFYTPSQRQQNADGNDFAARGATMRGSICLNGLRKDLHNGVFSVEEYMKFYMQMGYSLSGYYEVFGQEEAASYHLPDAIEPEGGDFYTETLIDYVIRMHKGKRLEI